MGNRAGESAPGSPPRLAAGRRSALMREAKGRNSEYYSRNTYIYEQEAEPRRTAQAQAASVSERRDEKIKGPAGAAGGLT